MLKMIVVGRVANATEIQTDPVNGKEYMILEVSSMRRYRNADGEYIQDVVPVRLGRYQAHRYLRMGFEGCKIAIDGELEVHPDQPSGFLVKGQQVEYLTFRRPEAEENEAAQEAGDVA